MTVYQNKVDLNLFNSGAATNLRPANVKLVFQTQLANNHVYDQNFYWAVGGGGGGRNGDTFCIPSLALRTIFAFIHTLFQNVFGGIL